MTIPDWDLNRVLPPIHPDTPKGKEHDLYYRAPYVAQLEEFISRFANTPQRVQLAERFLDYRTAIHRWAITEGFQWINGSFVENVEQGSNPRIPEDVDVVTFYYGNGNDTPLSRQLFDPEITGPNFNVDGYGVQLGVPLDVPKAVLTGHFYGLWSHRKGDHVWKGFIQVDLDPDEDPPARARLQVIKDNLGMI